MRNLRAFLPAAVMLAGCAFIARARSQSAVPLAGSLQAVLSDLPGYRIEEQHYSGEFGPLQLLASFTEQRVKNRDSGERLLRRANSFGSVGARYRLGNWRIGGEALASSNREDFEVRDPFGTVKLSGYSILNLTTSYQFTLHSRIALKVENALDKQYELVRGYNTQGRSLFVSLAHEFK